MVKNKKQKYKRIYIAFQTIHKVNQDYQVELIYNRILKELQVEINSKKWTKKELQNIIKNSEYQNNILDELNLKRDESVLNEVLKKLDIIIKNSDLKEKEVKTKVQIPTIWKIALGLKVYNKKHDIFKNKRQK